MNQHCLQMLWQLYSDVATRANLLVDECAHLQHTMQAHLSHASRNQFAFAAVPADVSPLKDRPWCSPLFNARGPEYYDLQPQDRALQNLYDTIGALASAIEDNAATLRGYFDRVLDQVQTQNKESDAIYWFVSLRGHLLGSVFDYYLEHIEHAQEKLIQLLENMPGALPGPTLMRRWSSGGYGEFLSNYSRQVHRQVQQSLWDFCLPAGPKAATTRTFDDWRANHLLVHTWSHNSTSRTTKNRIRVRHPEQTISTTTIWSSYFYLEQPILFPLLYHECAHHYENRTAAMVDKTEDEELEQKRLLWFGRAEEVSALLHRLLPTPDGDIAFWKQFAAELWSDLISLTQCGDGFFSALVLQITGLPTDDPAFSDYDTSEDVRIELQESGKPDRRILAVQYPGKSLGYFWVARAQFAIDAYKELFPKRTNGWVEGFEDLIDHWHTSGAVAMNGWMASHEHEAYWNYRKQLNNWVANVAWECFADLVKELKSLAENTAQRNEFILDPTLMTFLARDVNEYALDVFGKGPGDALSFDTKRQWRLEDLCPHIRWWVSEKIVGDLCDKTKINTSMERDRWLRTYLDLMSCDGSVAFRLAHEWLAIRDDLASTVGSCFKASNGFQISSLIKLAPWEQDHLAVLRRACISDIGSLSETAAQARLDGLAKAKYYGLSENWPMLDRAIKTFMLTAVLPEFEHFLGKDDNVGSFTLGVLKPVFIRDCENYGEAFRRCEAYYDALRQRRRKEIDDAGLHARTCAANYMPLFGEYSYAVFQPGLASINKGHHLYGHPPSIQKPRAALKLRSAPKSAQTNATLVRVSQVAFRYRWQWVLLARELAGKADIYLSSAWEDMILVNYYASLSSFDDECSKHQLFQRRWVDIHSSIGLPRLPSPHAVPAKPVVKDDDFIVRWSAYCGGGVREKTGRYDVAVTWSVEEPTKLWQALNAIPAAEWAYVESIATSMDTWRNGSFIHHSFSSQLILQHGSL